jgi:chemotaxis protein methyltransferase CheR
MGEEVFAKAAQIMSRPDFVRLKEFIYSECGIKITDAKKSMLEARLNKRLTKLGIASFSQYCDYLFSREGQHHELAKMIDQVTTNKTDFFREPAHFAYLTEKAAPDLLQSRRSLVLWSAGCSSGEEPYTLAMVLSETRCPFTILATDISTRVLQKAGTAVYDAERVADIPAPLRKKYLLGSRDRTKGLFRIVPELREKVAFRRLNLLDDDYGLGTPVDIIFCRNVIIYFDKQTQARLLQKLCRYLSPRGYVFLGHSETLLGIEMPLVQMAPTIYRKVS